MANNEARMTFIEHLGELRTRIIRSGIAVMVGFVVCYLLSDEILGLIARPLSPLRQQAADHVETDGRETGAQAPDGEALPVGEGESPSKEKASFTWRSLNLLEPFLVKLKVSAIAGILLVLPFLMYQVCAFIFPGLTPREKNAARVLIFGSAFLSISGVLVAYFGMFPYILPYLTHFAPDWVIVDLRLSEVVAQILKGLMGFAIAFQFPMIVLILVYLDLLTPAALREYRRFAIILAALIGAFLTPPDPFTMAVMMLPLVILYEFSIWMSYLVVWSRRKPRTEG